MCFFFQAEDGIRGIGVTGVQTCALPISLQYSKHFFTSAIVSVPAYSYSMFAGIGYFLVFNTVRTSLILVRSEERRVGKECRFRWSPQAEKRARTMCGNDHM